MARCSSPGSPPSPSLSLSLSLSLCFSPCGLLRNKRGFEIFASVTFHPWTLILFRMRIESNGQSRATPSGLRERDSRLVHFDPLMYRAPARLRVCVHLHTTGLWTSQAGPPFGSWFLVPGSCVPLLLPRIFQGNPLRGGAGRQACFQSGAISTRPAHGALAKRFIRDFMRFGKMRSTCNAEDGREGGRRAQCLNTNEPSL